jgi:hypothetical protein
MRTYASWVVVFGIACGSWACRSSSEHAPASVSAKSVEQQVVSAPSTPAQRVDAAAPAATPAPERSPAEWENVRLEDETPLCVFAGHAERGDALTLRDVRKQTLRANTRAVFGTFSPGCVSEACDAVPSHQCWVDREQPNTLVVHSRFKLEHKRGAVCTEACSPVVAGCETDVLRPGKYTVKYGARSFNLQVPSVVREPCFKL